MNQKSQFMSWHYTLHLEFATLQVFFRCRHDSNRVADKSVKHITAIVLRTRNAMMQVTNRQVIHLLRCYGYNVYIE